MTKKMNRIAAKQWADYRREQEQKTAATSTEGSGGQV